MATNKGKGGPVKVELKNEVMARLNKLIESGMIHGVTNRQLERELGVTRQTISKYIDNAYKHIKPDNINKVYLDFKALFDRLFRESYKMMNEAKTTSDKIKVIQLILQLIREKTETLERFFIKQKAVDNINLKADITTKQLMINYNMPEIE